MNKADLIEELRDHNGFSRRQADQVVELFFKELTNSLADGERVEIRGFGSFFVKNYKSYTGRNPKTGELVDVQPKRLPFFKCGKELRMRVDQC